MPKVYFNYVRFNDEVTPIVKKKWFWKYEYYFLGRVFGIRVFGFEIEVDRG